MDAEFWFKALNTLAITGWFAMALAPRGSGTRWLVHRGILPLLLSIAYFTLLLMSWESSQGNFGSLSGVKQLFANDWILLMGWVHYLAFDMLVGAWELRDSWNRQIPHGVMLPVLFATLMFGPVGFLGYQILALFWKPNQQEPTETTPTP